MPSFRNREGVELWYEEQGQGRALVLLHGWGMSSAVWAQQMKRLSAGFRVIALDMRGHGQSGSAPSGYDFEGFAADVVDLLAALEIRGACLLGWSMGAEVAIGAARSAEDRLAGLILVSGTPRFSAGDDFPHGLAPQESAGMAIKVRRNLGRALQGFTAGMFVPGELDDPTLAAETADMLARVRYPEQTVALASLKTLAESDLRGLLASIRLPTLVINGSADMVCLPAASDYLATSIHNSSHVVLNGCGHAPFITRPDEFAACIMDFCRRTLEFS
ncbi:MAG TPA: alpha/beta fold hydrolase [Deltaproteobacteria bacterium]|nr:alpha/beta fold hydrolase [Deltaproteobacteria bacterium]